MIKIIVAIWVVVSMCACASGTDKKVDVNLSSPIQEVRAINNFTSINLSAPVNIIYKISTVASLKIHAPKNIVPLLVTNVQNNQLFVQVKQPLILQEPIYIEVTSTALESIVNSGAADMSARNLEGKNLHIILSGTGNITAFGKIEQVDINSTGSGNADLAALKAAELRIDVFGTGNVMAFASDKVHVHVMSSGNVNVAGNPVERSTEPHGAGKISFNP